MNSQINGYDGEEIIQEMHDDLEYYKNRPNAIERVVIKKEDIITKLIEILSKSKTLKFYDVFEVIDNEISIALAKDPEIGNVKVFIPLSLTKKETLFINLTNTIIQDEK